MDLINIKVKHKVFGEGIIIAQENSYITVKFRNDEIIFVYPDIFDGYLVTENIDIAKNIKQRLETKNEKTGKEKQSHMTNNHKQPQGKTRAQPQENIAIKCNYCDGGRSNEQVGFNGVCSDEIIKNNIELEKRTWCSADDCDCGRYLKGKITRSQLDDICKSEGPVCYESQMLRDWKTFAGFVHSGKRKGQPMKFNQVRNNTLCVLTTRMPNSTERERYIFGVFLADETFKGDSHNEGYVANNSKYKLKLSPKQAKKMLFWNYHANKNKPERTFWGSGLHRYFGDEQAIQILRDIVKLKQDTVEGELAKEFLLYLARVNNLDIKTVPEKKGALQRK